MISTAYSPVGRPGDLVLRRLARLSPLDGDANTVLSSLDDLHALPAGAELVGERASITKPLFLLSGWAARVAILPDGRRQIIGFVLPGDAIGVYFRPDPLALAPMTTLTAVKVVNASPVVEAMTANPATPLADAMHLAAALHEAYLINQVVRLGRLTAYERLCHLLLELSDRMRLADLADERRFPLPLTQEILADATGLSTVHVNRTLQQLRRDRVLDLRAGSVVLLDRERMALLCDYAAPQPTRWRARAAL